MRDLSDDDKIQAKSCPEIQDGLTAEAKRLKRKGLKWKYRASHGPLMNWVFAWFLAQSNDERERIAREGHRLLTEMLSKPYEPGAPTSAPKPRMSKTNGRAGSTRRMKHGDTLQPVSPDHVTVNVD